MADSNYRQFIIDQLESRNLSTSGTIRVLEQRYESAVTEEKVNSEKKRLNFEEKEPDINVDQSVDLSENAFYVSKGKKVSTDEVSSFSSEHVSSIESIESTELSEFELKRGHKIFIGNCPFKFTEKDLCSYFKHCGPIIDCVIPPDGTKTKEYGFLIFEQKDSAIRAVRTMNSRIIRGRQIRVEMGRRDIAKPRKKKHQKKM